MGKMTVVRRIYSHLREFRGRYKEYIPPGVLTDGRFEGRVR